MENNNNTMEVESSEDPGTILLTANTLLMSIVAEVYDGDGNLAQRFVIRRSQTEKLIRRLYPKAILSESELVDKVQRAYNFF